MKRRKSDLRTESDEVGNSDNGSGQRRLFLMVLVVVLGVLLASLPIIVQFIHKDDQMSGSGKLPAEIAYLYQSYDRDENGYIDAREFEPIAHRLLATKVT